MTDYQRVAKVLALVAAQAPETPSIQELAKEAELSLTAFHRLFHRWVGTTPQAFLRCAILERAKKELRCGRSVLDASLLAGLSGPGRLHDLCVSFESASPGELKQGGQGWTIEVGAAMTPFGEALIAKGPRGLVHLSFHQERITPSHGMEWVQPEWPLAILNWDSAEAQSVAKQIFEPEPDRNAQRPPLKAFVRGSAFRVRVWRALLKVPFGALTTYGQLAREIGDPKACRAVGSAVGANPISFLIPCHRVIQESGLVGNYRWAPERKRVMLSWECASNAAHSIS